MLKELVYKNGKVRSTLRSSYPSANMFRIIIVLDFDIQFDKDMYFYYNILGGSVDIMSCII